MVQQSSPEAHVGKGVEAASQFTATKELARHNLQAHATELRLAGTPGDKSSTAGKPSESLDVAAATKTTGDKAVDKGAIERSGSEKTGSDKIFKADARVSLDDLAKAGVIKDATGTNKQEVAAGDKLASGEAPSVKVQMTDNNIPVDKRPLADFVVNKDGTVTMNRNPEKTGQKTINIEVERGQGQLMATEAQQKAVDELYRYLDGRIKGSFPDATRDGVKLDDPQNLVKETTEKELKSNNPANKPMADLPDEVRRQVEDMDRFRGTGEGTLSRREVDEYFPKREVPLQTNENDRIAAMKDVVAGFSSRGNSRPYEHIVYRGERGWGVGRYGLTYDMISNWLDHLDITELEKQEKEGKVPKGTVARMRQMKESVGNFKRSGDLSDLDPFLAKLKTGDRNNPVTAEEINANFGKEVQELASSHQVGRFSEELGRGKSNVDPGELALAMMLGRVASQDEINNNPDYKRFIEAARQAYNLSENRRTTNGDTIQFSDTSSLDQAMKDAVGKQLWRGYDGATQYGNLGCAITVTRILRNGGVPVNEILSVEGTKHAMRRLGARAVSLEEAIASGKTAVLIKQEGGSHTGILKGRTVVENSSGQRQTVMRDISRSSLRTGTYAFILPDQYQT